MKKLLVALLVLGLAAPAMAADVFMYGSFRTHLGYYDVSEEYGGALRTTALGGPDMDPTVVSSGAEDGFDDAGTVLSISGQSRFGAKAKITDSLSAVFESGLKETNRTSGQIEDIYLRLAYGVWNFGSGTFTFGKNYTPLTYLLYSNQIGDLGDQGEAILLVGGIPYAGRQPQLRLTFGGFDVALIEHNTAPAVAGLAADDIDFVFPKLEMAYTLNTPMISVRPAFGIQSYDAVTRGADEEEETVTSWIGALGVQLRFNPVYVNMMASYQVNAGNYGISNLVLGRAGVDNLLDAHFVGDDVEDSELISALLVVGAKLSPMVKLEGGVAYNNVQVDVAEDITGEQTAFVYYVQAPITVTPGVTITPELGMIDRGDYEEDDADDVALGEMMYGVVSFRVDF